MFETYPIPNQNLQHKRSEASPQIVAISPCERCSDRLLASVELDVHYSYLQLVLLPLLQIYLGIWVNLHFLQKQNTHTTDELDTYNWTVKRP